MIFGSTVRIWTVYTDPGLYDELWVHTNTFYLYTFACHEPVKPHGVWKYDDDEDTMRCEKDIEDTLDDDGDGTNDRPL